VDHAPAKIGLSLRCTHGVTATAYDGRTFLQHEVRAREGSEERLELIAFVISKVLRDV
jgi:hypothetical protein